MAALYRNTDEEYIVVHKLHGDKDAIEYLKRNSPVHTEGLLYTAKRMGQSTFDIRGAMYRISHERDNAYLIEPEDDGGG